MTCDYRKPMITPGWRTFHCDQCGVMWSETTRDYRTWSTEVCPKCLDDSCRPLDAWEDTTLQVDSNGNLVCHHTTYKPE